MIKLIALPFAFAFQAPPSPPVMVNEFSTTKTDQALSNTISCKPGGGDFSVDLRWRFREGLVHATVRRNGVALTQNESSKLVAALGQGTDLLSLNLGCSGSFEAGMIIIYAAGKNNQFSTMMLRVLIHPDSLELSKPTKVPLPY